jgi:hypothetical protein
MSTAAYLTTPKPSSVQLVDVMASCPPPPRRAADDTSMLVVDMSPVVPSLNLGNDDFFLAAPSSSPNLHEEHDDEKEFFRPFHMPISLKPRPSSNVRMAVPICTLKPRPAKQPVTDDVGMKMSASLQSSYQLSMNKKHKSMHRSPSFSSPAA